MALAQRSLFLYGFRVTENNRSIDFRAVAGETPRQASLTLGYYSLTSLCNEIVRAMQAVDATRAYYVTVDRAVAGGLQNRVTIATSGDFLQLLFGTGPRVATSAAALIGFAAADRSGATTYTGTASAGTAFSPTYAGFNFLAPEFFREIAGSVNISASGVKEAIVYSIQKFWQVEFRYEPKADVVAKWSPLMDWCIAQSPLEFTPEVGTPGVYYEGTLEKTDASSSGLAFKFTEMLPNYPGLYKTGLLTFRVKE